MNKKILVIDDDVDILDIVCIVLEDNGYDTIKSSTVDILAEIDIINPDLIILDNSIGAVSGSEICKKLKSTSTYENIPVILCSAAEELEKLSKGCGADCFLSKPFDLNELDTMVSKALTQQRRVNSKSC